MLVGHKLQRSEVHMSFFVMKVSTLAGVSQGTTTSILIYQSSLLRISSQIREIWWATKQLNISPIGSCASPNHITRG